MKISLATFLATIAVAHACPYLGYTTGGDNPHDTDAAAPCADDAMHVNDGSVHGGRALHRSRRRGSSDSQSTDGDASSRATGDDGTPLDFDAPRDAVDSLRYEVGEMVRSSERLGPQLVRLIFHDCVDMCDGCINLNNQDNNGLLAPIEALRPFVTKYSQYLTRTDVWAVAGMTAAETMQPRTKFDYRFEVYGRPTCDAAGFSETAGPERELPGVNLTTEQLLEYFRQHFNFDADETVAIMGAHTLGELNEENSGLVDGEWVQDETTLDNEFLRRVLDGNFDIEVAANGNAIWERNGGGDDDFFLNADLALAYDFAGSMDPNGFVTCNFAGTTANLGASNCASASTSAKLAEYASNGALWLEDFRNVFEKMVNNGINTTELLEVGLPSGNAAAPPSASPVVQLSAVVAAQSIGYLLLFA